MSQENPQEKPLQDGAQAGNQGGRPGPVPRVGDRVVHHGSRRNCGRVLRLKPPALPLFRGGPRVDEILQFVFKYSI